MTSDDGDFDFIDKVERAKAADKAKAAAIAAPKPRPRTTKAEVVNAYVDKAVRDECAELANLPPDSHRNEQLNIAAFNLGTLVGARVLTRSRAEHELQIAARSCKMQDDHKDGGWRQVLKTIKSGMDSGIKKPRDMSDVGQVLIAEQEPSTKPKSKPANTNGRPVANGHVDEAEARTINMVSAASIKTRVPTWVWEYDGVGRIQLGTLTMFAGKPTAGKSTAVRWFAAQISRGELPGVWHGYPMKVAMLGSEEQNDAVVVPGLVAAGADLSNIILPDFGDDTFLSVTDEKRLTEELVDNGIRALFVDPVMNTFGGKTDAYRNNEVRQHLQPYVRMASAMNGIVVTVSHLKKGDVRDVLAGINGSGAFGEVPRAVFGFAPLDNGSHVFEQVKNSAGPCDLKLEYKLPISYVDTDDGQFIQLPRFEIVGRTDVSIADINPNSDETTDIATAKNWLTDYLLAEQPAASAEVKRKAKMDGDIQPWTLKRAMRELRVKVSTRSLPGKPHTTVWTLPDYEGSL